MLAVIVMDVKFDKNNSSERTSAYQNQKKIFFFKAQLDCN